MPSSTFALFDEFGNELGKGGHNLSTGTLKVYLTNTAVSKANDTTSAAHTPITLNGGGEKTVTATWAETGAGTGVWRLSVGADQVWTASGGSFGPFQYAVLYNSSASNKLIGYWNYGTAITVDEPGTFTLDVDANFAAFTLTV